MADVIGGLVRFGTNLKFWMVFGICLYSMANEDVIGEVPI